MSSRALRSVRRQWRIAVPVLVAVAALVAGCIVVIRVTAGPGAPVAGAGTPVPVHVVRDQRVRVPAMRAWHRPAASWPAAGTATMALTAPTQRGARAGADPSAGSVRAGGLPVWVGPPEGGAGAVTAALVVRKPQPAWAA